MAEPKSEQFVMRLSPTEQALLRGVADATGLSASDVLRQAIRREAKRLGVPVPPAKARKGRR